MNHNWIDKARKAEQGHKIPVSDTLWTRIQEVREQQRKQRLRVVWIKRSAVAVAVCLVAIVCINKPWDNKHEMSFIEYGSKSQTNECVIYEEGKIIDDKKLVLSQMKKQLGDFSDVSEIVGETMENQLSEMSVMMED